MYNFDRKQDQGRYTLTAVVDLRIQKTWISEWISCHSGRVTIDLNSGIGDSSSSLYQASVFLPIKWGIIMKHISYDYYTSLARGWMLGALHNVWCMTSIKKPACFSFLLLLSSFSLFYPLFSIWPFQSSPLATESWDSDVRSQNHLGCTAFKFRVIHLSLREVPYSDPCVGTTVRKHNIMRHSSSFVNDFIELRANPRQQEDGGNVHVIIYTLC